MGASAGDPAACDPENDERLEPCFVEVRGGFIAAGCVCGVEGTEVEGVIGAPVVVVWMLGGTCSVCSDALVMTEPVSDVVEARRIRFGRELDGIEGVRDCRISMRVARDTG